MSKTVYVLYYYLYDHSQCLKAVFTSKKLMDEYISKFVPESKRKEWYSEALQLDPSEECE